MFMMALVVILLSAGVGYLAKVLLDNHYFGTNHEITWTEYWLTLLVICLVLVPLTSFVGYRLAVKSLLTYNEYWNGSEQQAWSQRVECTRDGPCKWEYDCDPYIVSYTCGCNDKGVCSTCTRTEYHACPYCAFEEHYFVDTTLGTYTFAKHRLPEDPHANRWQPQRRKQLPERVIQAAGVGAPQLWSEVLERLSRRDNGPVTQVNEYDNYILASDETILKQYSAEVDRYKAEGLLPLPTSGVHNFYLQDKVHFINMSVPDAAEWQDALGRLNARLGALAQGDLHLVVIHSQAIEQPRSYANALKAYWQSKEHKPDSFAKNGIAIILGVNFGKVQWAEGFTGMPEGNTKLALAVREKLPSMEFDRQVLLGRLTPHLPLEAGHVGAVGDLVFGLSSPDTKFVRVSMTGEGEDDVGTGSLYLRGEIEPLPVHRFYIGLMAFFLSALSWTAAIAIGERRYGGRGW